MRWAQRLVRAMSAAVPTARTAHPLLQLADDPADMLVPLLWSLHGDRPANPFIARKWRDVFPGRQSLGIGR